MSLRTYFILPVGIILVGLIYWWFGREAAGSVMLIVFGFVMAGVDNWAHLGGFGGGYLASRWLDPLRDERGDRD